MRYKFFTVIATAALTSLLTLGIVAHYQKSDVFAFNGKNQLPVNYVGYTDGSATIKSSGPIDFQQAAESSVKAVVHIKTSTKARTVYDDGGDDFFSQMFGQRQQYTIPQQIGSGSGVVISPDGYIVTNNHVVDGADEVTVTFNNKYTTKAKVIAKDPSTDVALIKVDEKNLPYMEFGNSDNVKLGQWVLAVGYPLTLDATVTAGIVSAKSRSIGINRYNSDHPVESFIQTDAAVNPGNSGGALVNTSGQLIGINAAIASPTGSYAGYSYAIPSNIVRKAVNDLMKYGSVQRGYLGIQYIDTRNLNTDELKKLGLDKDAYGVYVANVLDNSGAQKAGIKKGDFITGINGDKIETEADLQAKLLSFQPGDNINVSYTRDGKTYNATAQLKNELGNTALVRQDQNTLHLLGADFRELTAQEKDKYNLDFGVVVTDIGKGILAKQTNIRKGFIVLSINDVPLKKSEDLQKALNNTNDINIEGWYPGSNGRYFYSLRGDSMKDSQ
jgi:Do/DeqQ family serine protease